MRVEMKFIYLGITVLWYGLLFDGSWSELLKTNDQKAYALFEKKEYGKAAEIFEESMSKGASFFKDGAFKKAKAIYGTMSSKEARYNLGNSELMLGAYDKAIEAYELSLKIDPNFKEAKENRELAIVRKKLKEYEHNSEEGIGDMYDMQPDEILYDNTENKGVDDQRHGKNIQREDNAHWLDSIQTSPKAFLKNKFSYQYQMKEATDAK